MSVIWILLERYQNTEQHPTTICVVCLDQQTGVKENKKDANASKKGENKCFIGVYQGLGAASKCW